MPDPAPLPNAYWVIPGKLLAGDHPGLYPGRTQQRVASLIQAGILCAVSLSTVEEGEPYARWLQVRSFPVHDMMTPSTERMIQILDAIDAEAQEGAVYVHCRAGLGRTGLVVGCFLVRHGMDGESALAKITSLRGETAQAWKSSPETESQRQMVGSWKNGQ